MPAEGELGWRAGQRAGRWTSSAVLLTAANEPTPVKARSAERVDERRDATWSCRSSPTVSSGPGPRTDFFGLLYDPRTLTNACLKSIYVAHCKRVVGLLPGITGLAPPRDARETETSNQANKQRTKVRDCERGRRPVLTI